MSEPRGTAINMAAYRRALEEGGYQPVASVDRSTDVYGPIAGALNAIPNAVIGRSTLDAAAANRRLEEDLRGVGELIYGPEDLINTGRRVFAGNGDLIDYGVLGLSVLPMPAAVRRGIGRFGRRIADSRFGRAMLDTNGTVYEPEDVADIVQSMYDSGASRPEVDAYMSALGTAYSDPAEASRSFMIRDAQNALAARPVAPDMPPPPSDFTVRVDNPGGEWLEHQRRRSAEHASVSPISGAVTASLSRVVDVDPVSLAAIPGARGEVRVPGESQYDQLRSAVEQEGFRRDSPILIGVNHEGQPYIIEGNTRAAVARDLGVPSIPAEVRWFAGGEQVPGGFSPARLPEILAPPPPLAVQPVDITRDELMQSLSVGRLRDTPAAPVSARGVHYSRIEDLARTDPSFYGTGHIGSERQMVRSEKLPDRTYFYSEGADGTPLTPEEPVAQRAPYQYEADLQGLYDVNSDPEGLVALANRYNPEGTAIPDLERLIQQYGYRGYISDYAPSWAPQSRRAAAMFEPVDVRRMP
jgi:hypothetical protein